MFSLSLKKIATVGALAIAVPLTVDVPAFAATPNAPAISHAHPADGARLLIFGQGDGPTGTLAANAAHQDAINKLSQVAESNNLTCTNNIEAINVERTGPASFHAQDQLTADCESD